MKSHEEIYEEERAKPLLMSRIREEYREGLLLRWFTINGHGDEPIPMFLAHPEGGLSRKLFLFLHGLGGRKEDALYLKGLAGLLGFSMLAIDARRHGDRKSANDVSISAADMIADMSRTIVDNRLAIDAALQEGWADRGSIILAGASMGGILGGVVVAVDERIAGAVLYVPGGDLIEIISRSKHPTVERVRRGVPSFMLKMFSRQVAMVDPINYIDRISPRPLLIQLGRYDEYVPFENGMKLFEKAKEPKQLVVHESSHELPLERAFHETEIWIRKNFPRFAP